MTTTEPIRTNPPEQLLREPVCELRGKILLQRELQEGSRGFDNMIYQMGYLVQEPRVFFHGGKRHQTMAFYFHLKGWGRSYEQALDMAKHVK